MLFYNLVKSKNKIEETQKAAALSCVAMGLTAVIVHLVNYYYERTEYNLYYYVILTLAIVLLSMLPYFIRNNATRTFQVALYIFTGLVSNIDRYFNFFSVAFILEGCVCAYIYKYKYYKQLILVCIVVEVMVISWFIDKFLFVRLTMFVLCTAWFWQFLIERVLSIVVNRRNGDVHNYYKIIDKAQLIKTNLLLAHEATEPFSERK